MRAARNRTRRLWLFALPTTGLVTLVLGVSAAPALAGNEDFVGTWNPTTDQPWTIASQEPDGTCTGTTSLAGFTFTECFVSGDQYEFTLVEGSYSSHNHGTFEGNSLTGEFNDTSGHNIPYTATREVEPTVSIAGEPSVALPESGTETETFTVSLSEASSATVEVDYATEDGTATVADDDYSEESGVLAFEPGQTSKQVTVTIDGGDGKDTGALEHYEVNLLDDSKGAAVSLTAGSATGTIGLPGFSGHAYDGKGKPLAGVKLTLAGRTKSGTPVSQEVSTEANGAYAIAVDPGEYSIYAHGVPAGQPTGLKWTPGAACPGVASGAYCEKIYLASSDGKPVSAKVDFAYGDPDPEAENLEVLQAVQAKAFDTAGPQITLPDGTKATSFTYNGLSLGAGSPTIVRLYGANNGAVTAESVNAQLRGYSSSGGNLVELPGGPLPALDNGINLLEAPQFDADRPLAASTFNFMIPESWTTTAGPITLVGTVDPAKTFPECSKCRDNDSVALSGVTFTKEKPLAIRPIPLTWIDKGKTVAPNNPAGTIEAAWPFFPLARNQLVLGATSAPLDLSGAIAAAVAKAAKAKQPVSGDPQSLYSCLSDTACGDVLGPSILTMEMEVLGAQWKQTQAQVNGIPVGIFKGDIYAGTYGETAGWEPHTLFSTDAFLGNNESLPHEILHALGFMHTAGCGSPASPEAYPANPPEILGYGVNRSSTNVGGIGKIEAPPLYQDLMSYCRPRWISAPTWNRVVTRLATGTLPPPSSSLAAATSLHDPKSFASSAGRATVEAVVIDGKPVILGIGAGRAPGGSRSALSLQTVGAGGRVTTVAMRASEVELESTSGLPPLQELSAEIPARAVSSLRISRAGHLLTSMRLPAQLGLKVRGERHLCPRGGYATVPYTTKATSDLVRARLLAGRGAHLKLVVLGGQPGTIRVASTKLPKGANRVRLTVSDGLTSSSVTLALHPRC
jgi:Calx-beta domain